MLLDVMGTLVRDPFYEDVPAFFGTTLEELLVLKHPTAWAEFERGELEESELERRFFLDERAYDHAGLRAVMVRGYEWLDGMQELCSELVARGHELHAFSNYPDWWRLIEEKLGLARYLRWSFVSCDLGVRKPSRRAYAAVLERLARPARDCVFVDDREANCVAARQAGIDSIRFRSASDLRAALVARGIL